MLYVNLSLSIIVMLLVTNNLMDVYGYKKIKAKLFNRTEFKLSFIQKHLYTKYLIHIIFLFISLLATPIAYIFNTTSVSLTCMAILLIVISIQAVATTKINVYSNFQIMEITDFESLRYYLIETDYRSTPHSQFFVNFHFRLFLPFYRYREYQKIKNKILNCLFLSNRACDIEYSVEYKDLRDFITMSETLKTLTDIKDVRLAINNQYNMLIEIYKILESIESETKSNFDSNNKVYRLVHSYYLNNLK